MTAPAVTHLHGSAGEPALLLRRLKRDGPPVLYVHGATFPSALSVAYRFNGKSWMDDLAARGLDVWAFDFAGFGGSDRLQEMNGPQNAGPIGRAPMAAAQIARVTGHIAKITGHQKIALIAHSWGTLAAGLYASERAACVSRLVLFGPILQRAMTGLPAPDSVGAWRLVTIADQLTRFSEDLPAGHPPVLIDPDLAQWGPAFLASDDESTTRIPQAVKIPAGPSADILAAWSGALSWNPARVTCPAMVVRGAWDHITTDADVAWLFAHLAAPVKRDAKIPKGTHLMHLEHARDGLFVRAGDFLTEAFL